MGIVELCLLIASVTLLASMCVAIAVVTRTRTIAVPADSVRRGEVAAQSA